MSCQIDLKLNSQVQALNIELQNANTVVYIENWVGPGAGGKVACLESKRSRVRPPLCHSKFKRSKMFLLCF